LQSQVQSAQQSFSWWSAQ